MHCADSEDLRKNHRTRHQTSSGSRLRFRKIPGGKGRLAGSPSVVNTALLVTMAFLLGLASFLHLLSPFGPSFVGSIIALGLGSPAAVGISALLGEATALGLSRTVPTALVMVLEWALFRKLLIKPRAGFGEMNKLKVASIVLVSTAAVGSAYVGLTTAEVYGFMLVGFEAGISFILTMVFLQGLDRLVSVKNGKADMRIVSPEEAICGGILVASAASGLTGVRLGPLSLDSVVGGALILAMAVTGGSGIGAAAGVAMGVLNMLSGSGDPTMLGFRAFSGLTAGAFRELGRLGAGLGFLLGTTILCLYSTSADRITIHLMESVASLGIVLLIPPTVFQKAGLLVPSQEILNQIQVSRESRLRNDLSNRIHEISVVFKDLSRAFRQISATSPLADATYDEIYALFPRIQSSVCRNCFDFEVCWKRDRSRTAQAILDWMSGSAMEEQALMVVSNRALPECPRELALSCAKKGELIREIMHWQEMCGLNARWKSKVNDCVNLLPDHFKGVSHILDRLASEVRIPAQDLKLPKLLDFEIGMARVSKNNGSVSGDTFLVKELDGARLLMALSDGMGTGSSAAVESRATISLVERLMDVGFPRDVAVEMVNAVLVSRSGDEVFATLDLTTIDLTTGMGQFVKIAAQPTFIKRSSDVIVIKSSSVPVGILPNIQVESVERVLSAGDMVVMVTDGIVDSRKPSTTSDETWVVGFLRKTHLTSPKDLAQSLVDRALDNYRMQGRAEIGDDMTVVVAKLISAKVPTVDCS